MFAVLEHSLYSVASMLQTLHGLPYGMVPAAALGEPELWRRGLLSVDVQRFHCFGEIPASGGLSFEHQFPAVPSLN